MLFRDGANEDKHIYGEEIKQIIIMGGSCLIKQQQRVLISVHQTKLGLIEENMVCFFFGCVCFFTQRTLSRMNHR